MAEESNTIVLDAERAARVLSEIAPSIFGEMAFMDAVPVAVAWGPEADAASRVEDGVHIAIDMLKPLSCRLELEFPRALSDRMNETLYGPPDASPEAVAEGCDPEGGDDSTLELLNVLAGSFLSGCFGAGASFKLELPFFIFGAAEVSGPAIARVGLDAEGLPVDLTLRSIRYRY